MHELNTSLSLFILPLNPHLILQEIFQRAAKQGVEHCLSISETMNNQVGVADESITLAGQLKQVTGSLSDLTKEIESFRG